DMIAIKFDKDFKVVSAKIYPKNQNNIELPAGSMYSSTVALGKFIKYNYGAFDFEYVQTSKDLSNHTIYYSDFERSKGYKGATFNAISISAGGKTTTDKLELKSEASSLRVLPAKIGQV
ncbi:MAG: DUF6770 family protein, partial [Chitinophagaceae bacterium]